MSQCVRTNTVSVWCYECHQFYAVVVCEVPERKHKGHRTYDYERGATAHRAVCVPSMLMPSGELPTPRKPCLCVEGVGCIHDNHASNHA